MGDVVRFADRAEAPSTRSEQERRRYDATTHGVDEYLQGVGGDPFHGHVNLGLRIPALPTTDASKRYLFLCVQQKLSDGQVVRVRGLGQYWSLGFLTGSVDVGHYPVEIPVTSPNFTGSDFNVSWHWRFMNLREVSKLRVGPLDTNNFAKWWTDGQALLYQTATFAAANLGPNGKPDYYTTLTGYTPPKLGRPWGDPLAPGLGELLALETPIQKAFGSTDLVVRGPGVIAGFASVRQSNPSTRVPPPTPATVYQGGLTPETAFLLNYPNAIPWRVAMRLITEDA